MSYNITYTVEVDEKKSSRKPRWVFMLKLKIQEGNITGIFETIKKE